MDKYMTPGWFGVGLITLVLFLLLGWGLAVIWVGLSLVVHSWYNTLD